MILIAHTCLSFFFCFLFPISSGCITSLDFLFECITTPVCFFRLVIFFVFVLFLIAVCFCDLNTLLDSCYVDFYGVFLFWFVFLFCFSLGGWGGGVISSQWMACMLFLKHPLQVLFYTLHPWKEKVIDSWKAMQPQLMMSCSSCNNVSQWAN